MTCRCVVVPRKVWVRHRRKILDTAKRIYWEWDAAQLTERQATEKAAGKLAKKATGRCRGEDAAAAKSPATAPASRHNPQCRCVNPNEMLSCNCHNFQPYTRCGVPLSVGGPP
jgi:hypothetical protein